MQALLKKSDILFITALLLSIWALATGIIWIYWAALYLSYPAVMIAFLIWNNIRTENKGYHIMIPVLLVLALIFSFGTLFLSK